MRRALAALLLCLAACASAPPEPREIPATREDVARALRAQFDLVLARNEALRGDGDVDLAAAHERDDLHRLAAEIATRIVRVDPGSHARELASRLEAAR